MGKTTNIQMGRKKGVAMEAVLINVSDDAGSVGSWIKKGARSAKSKEMTMGEDRSGDG